MNETWLRWQARIGAAKAAALCIGLLALFFLAALIPSLLTALNNPAEPQRVQIGQLVREEIDADRYVSVAGVALYPVTYEETANDKHVASYYGLLNVLTKELAWVRTTEPLPAVEQEAVTIVGMTRAVPTDFRRVIENDLPQLSEAGLTATPNFYLADGEKPGNAAAIILGIAGLALLALLCAATIFFPGTVFHPHPVAAGTVPAMGTSVAKASGRLQKLKRVEPSPELGRGSRRFREASANLVPLEAQQLMVHIHYVLRHTLYGVIPLFKQQSDWAVVVDPSHTRDIEPGKLYGWRDRWAVRLRYRDQKDKPQDLVLSFDDAGAQAGFLQALQQTGFSVGTGSSASA